VKALEYFHKAQDIQLTVGETHLIVGRTYCSMAGVYREQGEYVKALEYYHKALAIKLTLGDPSVGITYYNMAVVCEKQEEYSKALEYYNKALTIILPLGPTHPHVQLVNSSIARLKIVLSAEDIKEAEATIKK
jgi:tetratricopeptide (TPR) repeat protein